MKIKKIYTIILSMLLLVVNFGSPLEISAEEKLDPLEKPNLTVEVVSKTKETIEWKVVFNDNNIENMGVEVELKASEGLIITEVNSESEIDIDDTSEGFTIFTNQGNDKHEFNVISNINDVDLEAYNLEVEVDFNNETIFESASVISKAKKPVSEKSNQDDTASLKKEVIMEGEEYDRKDDPLITIPTAKTFVKNSGLSDTIAVDKNATRCEGCRTFEVTLDITGTPQHAPVDVVLVIDRSGSMNTRVGGWSSNTRLYYAKQAAGTFANKVLGNNGIPGSRVSIVSFSGPISISEYGNQNQASTDLDLTDNLANVTSTINSISAVGGTNTQAGFLEGKSVIENTTSLQNPNSNKVLIMFTDGLPTASNGNQYFESTNINHVHNQQAIIAGQSIHPIADVYTIGLTTGLDATEKALANTILTLTANKTYYPAPSAQDLESIFTEISENLGYAATQAVVKDKIGDSFNLVQSSLPTGAVYDSNTREITWTPGTIMEHSQLKYKIVAKDSFAGGLADTNEYATLAYKDIFGVSNQTKEFPIPEVDVPTRIQISLTDTLIYRGDSISLGVETDPSSDNYMSPVTGGDNDGTNFNYQWRKVGNINIISTEKNPTVSPEEDTEYEVSVIDSNGCIATAIMKVTVIQFTEFTANKVWLGGSAIDRPEVQLQLYRHIEGEEPVTHRDSEVLEGSEHTWTNLEVTDEEGNPYIYSFKELDVANYQVSYDGNTVTNTYVSPTNGEFTASKQWIGGTKPLSEVRFQLYRNIEDGNKEAVGSPLSLTGLTYTWDNLKETDGEGNPYIYSFEESTVPEYYTVTYEGNIAINTFKLGSLKLLKVDNEGSVIKDVEFKLTSDVEGQNVVEANSLTAVNGVNVSGELSGLLTDENGKIVITGLLPGTYYLHETKANAGYRLLDKPVEIIVTSNEEVQTTIVNYENAWTLPPTGGMGSSIYYFAGFILMVYAIINYKKEKYNRKKGFKMLETRKTISKFLLAFALLFSMMAPNVMSAIENGPAPEDNPGSASLIIYKFEQEPGVENPITGDGSYGQMPTGTPVEGVEFTITLKETFNPNTNEWQEVSNGVVLTATTDSEGKVVYDSSVAGFVLGSYTVQETDGPDHIILNTNEYKVDIPMTNATGTELNYNVYVYPKNTIIREDVELIKYDENQGLLEGAKFILYNEDETRAKDKEGTEIPELTTNSEGKINVSGLAAGSYYFQETYVPDGYAINNRKLAFTIQKVDAEGNPSATGQFIALTWTNITAVLNDGSVINYDEPTIDKDVEGLKEYKVDRDQEFEYNITTTLPGDIKEYEEFIVTDTLDARLTYVSHTDVAGVTFAQNGQLLTWTFDPAQHVAQDVVLTFKAKIKVDAVLEFEETGILNTATLAFDNGHGATGNKTPDEPPIVVPKDGGFKVIKVQKDDNTVKLAGAEFKLTDANANTIDTTTFGDVVKVNGQAFNGLLEDLVTRADGTFEVTGLTPGTYYLYETKAPTITVSGEERTYRLLAAPIEITIVDDTDIDVTVENAFPFFVLPVTGGIGTILFTASGLSLMGVALLAYLRRRKTYQ